MADLTALDIIVLLLVGGGLALGVMRGFVCELLSLFAWMAAVIALKLFFDPVSALLTGVIGTESGAAVMAFALVFGITYILGKILARRAGSATRTSAIGPVDRVLGGGFGALKGLIGATLLFLGANLVYDTMWGQVAKRPDWMMQSRTYPLLHASGRAIVDFVEARRGRPANDETSDRLGQ